MTQVSKYPLNLEEAKRVKEIFLITLAKLKTTEDVNAFLEEFLTPTENIMLAKRFSIAVLLVKGFDIRGISKTLKVSPTTVTYMNRWIKHNKGYLAKVVKEFLDKEANEEKWNKIGYEIGKATIPLTTSNWSERRRNLEKEKFK